MSFWKLKEQLVQRKFKKDLLLSPEIRAQNTKKIRSVGILATDEFLYRFDVVRKVYDALENVEDIRIFSYRKFDKSHQKLCEYFTEKDINWRGRITDFNLESFLDNPFDLLIGYFNEKHLYLEFATLKSKAAFKIGFTDVNDKLFDLIIAEKIENSSSFTNEIHKYLESLDKA